ncbi:hypothetical protein PoB_005716600 [Plakobranchus ocellatus]|uniref:Uncharacterized protein n=1 Tax=Plakobranchus ocellatus TaxID=259542 RepID=A0AAV4CGY6_9GAST|nr:hypothetical protein PoB_005716600 [Plakobranchus ocellatus]
MEVEYHSWQCSFTEPKSLARFEGESTDTVLSGEKALMTMLTAQDAKRPLLPSAPHYCVLSRQPRCLRPYDTNYVLAMIAPFCCFSLPVFFLYMTTSTIEAPVPGNSTELTQILVYLLEENKQGRRSGFQGISAAAVCRITIAVRHGRNSIHWSLKMTRQT